MYIRGLWQSKADKMCKRQTNCAKGRLGWVARLSNRVRCLKPFAILGRNNSLKSPQRGSAGAAKEITNRGPITESRWLLQHDLCYLNVAQMWWLPLWIYCLQSIESSLVPCNLNTTITHLNPEPCHRALCHRKLFYIPFLYLEKLVSDVSIVQKHKKYTFFSWPLLFTIKMQAYLL